MLTSHSKMVDKSVWAGVKEHSRMWDVQRGSGIRILVTKRTNDMYIKFFIPLTTIEVRSQKESEALTISCWSLIAFLQLRPWYTVTTWCIAVFPNRHTYLMLNYGKKFQGCTRHRPLHRRSLRESRGRWRSGSDFRLSPESAIPTPSTRWSPLVWKWPATSWFHSR